MKSEKSAQLFLFNDLIILTRNKSKDQNKRKFEVLHFIPMDSMKTVDMGRRWMCLLFCVHVSVCERDLLYVLCE
jgi:hypothetical protein